MSITQIPPDVNRFFEKIFPDDPADGKKQEQMPYQGRYPAAK